MREILFRGKRLDNGEWVYGYYVYEELYKTSIIEANEKTGGDGYINPRYQLTSYEVNSETVGQYTGFKDENEEKIFEGDVIRGTYDEMTYQNKVIFADCGFSLVHNNNKYGYCAPLEEHESIELIGNTVDNPELIN